MYVLYTDNYILFARNKHTIKLVIRELREEDLQLTVEGTVADF